MAGSGRENLHRAVTDGERTDGVTDILDQYLRVSHLKAGLRPGSPPTIRNEGEKEHNKWELIQNRIKSQ